MVVLLFARDDPLTIKQKVRIRENKLAARKNWGCLGWYRTEKNPPPCTRNFRPRPQKREKMCIAPACTGNVAAEMGQKRLPSSQIFTFPRQLKIFFKKYLRMTEKGP